jgi:protein-tyrosine-phosphatase
MLDQPAAVLFACTNNSVRSPMAEGILKHLRGRHIYVDSVGIREREINGFAVEAMREIGINLSRHRPKTFDDLWDTSFDLVISLSPEAQHRAVEMTRVMACDVEFWNTFDPSIIEGSRETCLQAFRDVRDGLIERIRKRFPEFLPPPE